VIAPHVENADPSIVVGSWFEICLRDRSGKYLANESLYLASACITCGFERRAIPATRTLSRDSEEIIGWWVNVRKESETGYKFMDVWNGWFRPKTVPSEHRIHNLRRYAQFHHDINRARRAAQRISPEETIRRKTISHLSGCTNTKQAASLLELGFELDSRLPVSVTDVAGRDQATFWFAIPPADKPRFIAMVQGWMRFAEFESKDPEHPMCYHRTYGENREDLANDCDRTQPQILIRRGNRWMRVSENLNTRRKKQLERML
jgi:hypothetical protein